MYNTAIIVVLYAAILESIIIIVGNVFIIFVFWKHRNSFSRTFLLVINLAVADLFVGFIEPILIGAYGIPWHLEEKNFHHARNTSIGTAFQITFGFASVLFLTLISLERAYALIWPLRHRVTSTKVYSYSATLTWIAAILAGILTLLTALHISSWISHTGKLELVVPRFYALPRSVCLIWQSEQDLAAEFLP